MDVDADDTPDELIAHAEAAKIGSTLAHVGVLLRVMEKPVYLPSGTR